MDERQLHQIKFLAGIGHVCLQWALLETTLLMVLNAFQNLPTEEGAVVFGSLAMEKRCSMAINLPSHHKAPAHIIRELKGIRAALQKDGADISNRRNQAVHGVHKDATDPATFTLTMFSWNIAKRHKDLTPEDFYALTEEIHALQRRTYGVFEDIGRWKFPGHGEVNRSNDLGAAPPAIRLKLAQRLYASIQHFWRNLFS